LAFTYIFAVAAVELNENVYIMYSRCHLLFIFWPCSESR